MIRWNRLVVGVGVLVGLCGCQADEGINDVPFDVAASFDVICPGADVQNATRVAQYVISKTAIAQGCGSEECIGGFPDTTTVSISVDAAGNIDSATFQCPDQSWHTVYSNNSCWYCWGCGAPLVCTGGEDFCGHVTGQSGADCGGFVCPSGYTMNNPLEPYWPTCIETQPECCDSSDCDAGDQCSDGYCVCTTDPTCTGRSCDTSADCTNGTCGGGVCRAGTCMCPS